MNPNPNYFLAESMMKMARNLAKLNIRKQWKQENRKSEEQTQIYKRVTNKL